MTDCRYGRDLSQKGKNSSWISADLDIMTGKTNSFFIVLRDGVHAISTDMTKEKLEEWLAYIKQHENKIFEESVK